MKNILSDEDIVFLIDFLGQGGDRRSTIEWFFLRPFSLHSETSDLQYQLDKGFKLGSILSGAVLSTFLD